MGTFILTFVGCGAVVSANAMLASTNGSFGYVEIIGIGLAFGIALLAAAYSVGHVSGGHFNPAVSIGLAVSGRFAWAKVIPYAIAQVIGAVLAGLLLLIVAGGTDFGLGQTTAGGFGVAGAFLMEILMTFMLVFIILGTTCEDAAAGFAGLPIGLYLGAAQIIGIPYSGASLNPARSFGPAIFAGGAALTDLWIFILAPVVGAVLAALVNKLTTDACFAPSGDFQT
jgi:aquaporin Z